MSPELKQMVKDLKEEETLEDLFIAVDGGFAEIPESALDDFLFAERVSHGDVLRGRSMERSAPYASGFDWRKNIFSFKQSPWITANRHADKLHSKMMYVEYTDEHKQRRHLLIWGSGNSSSNSGKLSFDVFYVLESPDPKLGEQVKLYIDGVKEEKRLKPYYQTYLIRRLLETFGSSIKGIVDMPFVNRLGQYLSAKQKRYTTLGALLKTLEQTKTKEIYGKNILIALRWILNHPTLSNKFGWNDWNLLLNLCDPYQREKETFYDDLGWFWVESTMLGNVAKYKVTNLQRSYKAMLSKLTRIDVTPNTPAIKSKRLSKSERIIQDNVERNCGHFLSLNVGYEPHSVVEAWGKLGNED
jgi:hypothetical protein